MLGNRIKRRRQFDPVMSKRDAAAAECDEIGAKRTVTTLVSGSLVRQMHYTSREMRLFLEQMRATGCVEMRADDHAALRSRAADIVALLDDPARTRIAQEIDWTQMPRDCWRIIIGMVGDAETLAALRGTCRRFRELANALTPRLTVHINELMICEQMLAMTSVKPHPAAAAVHARFSRFPGASRLVILFQAPSVDKKLRSSFNLQEMLQPAWDHFVQTRNAAAPGALTLQLGSSVPTTGSVPASWWYPGDIYLNQQRLAVHRDHSIIVVSSAYDAYSIYCDTLIGHENGHAMQTMKNTTRLAEFIVVGARFAKEPSLQYCTELLTLSKTVYQYLASPPGGRTTSASPLTFVAEYIHYRFDITKFFTDAAGLIWLISLFWGHLGWASHPTKQCEVHLWVNSSTAANAIYKLIFHDVVPPPRKDQMNISIHIHTNRPKTKPKGRVLQPGLTLDYAYEMCWLRGSHLYHTPGLSQHIISKWCAQKEAKLQ